MNTYLYPMSSDGDVWIEKIIARSIADAERRVANKLREDYDLESEDYQDVIEELSSNGISIGDFYDVDTFLD